MAHKESFKALVFAFLRYGNFIDDVITVSEKVILRKGLIKFENVGAVLCTVALQKSILI